MKKPLFILLLVVCGLNTQAQSIGLFDLINLTSLNGEQINNYFVAGRTFRLQYGEEVNGFVVKHYQTNAPAGKLETVLTGAGYKTANGTVLYTASYVTANAQNILKLVEQTKTANLKESFQGADAANNIFIYDNFLYHIVIKLNFSQTIGSVDVTQKQVFAQ